MEFKNPFEIDGKWFKGNIHTHTKNSDGKYTPEEVIEKYKENGYDFLVMTDHNKITKINSSSDFLVIPGIEICKDGFHIIGLDIEEEFEFEKLSAQEIIDKINELKGIAVLCHPYWCANKSYEILKLKNYIGIEIYNSTCEKGKGKGYSTVHWDEILETGEKIYGFAVDDCHGDIDMFDGFIMVKSNSLNKENILSAIKEGLFYSSTGILIKNLKIKNSEIEVEISDANWIDFIGYNATGRRIYINDEKKIKYEIKGNEKYIRIEVTDKNFKKTWLNPIFLKNNKP